MLRKTSMKQERWQRLKEIVADALEEDSPAARTALLNRECADDLSLLREAESFLANADTVAAEGMDRLEECACSRKRRRPPRQDSYTRQTDWRLSHHPRVRSGRHGHRLSGGAGRWDISKRKSPSRS
jgi:hypothetical protein